MLVYGDHSQKIDPRVRASQINRDLERASEMAAGIERHARLVSALVDAGQLLQGIADAHFAISRRDGATEATDALNDFLLQLARVVCRSWDSQFDELSLLPRPIERADWPKEIEIRLPEGFAFYSVYPEAFIEAARRLRLVAPPRVIGIRSIGTTLGAVVAAALDAPRPVTLRPFGDPSNREVALEAALEQDLLGGDVHYVIVDEGPGQSGSSFASIGKWLQARGVPLERIALLPSHEGSPGASATPPRRAWWAQVQREPATLHDLGGLVSRWAADALGCSRSEVREISAGHWRDLLYASTRQWPAAVPSWERQKFLAHRDGPVLLRFAGIGRTGEEKLAIARTLHAEGLVPEPLGLVHGFLAERWHGDARALAPGDKPVAELARYLVTRARLLPSSSGDGADIRTLLAMARRNLGLEFGAGADAALDEFEDRCDDLQRRVVRVRTDNRMLPHEWIETANGRLLKTDAIDHHQGHDLIGCQDIAWDVAATSVEFDLDQEEEAGLLAELEAAAVKVDRTLLAFYRMTYLAFRLGQMRLGAAMSGPDERVRIQASGNRYSAKLQHLVQSRTGSTRQKSLVG